MISVLVPTRGRPTRLAALIASFAATVTGGAELVFRVDDDDWGSREILRGQRVVAGPRLQGYWSLPAFFDECVAVARGEILMLGNDDMLFRTPAWDAAVHRAASAWPDGLYDLGYATFNQRVFPFATVSRVAVERVGSIAPVQLADLFWRDVMAAFGRTVLLEHVRIDHDWAGHAPDATHREADPPSIWTRRPHYAAEHAAAVAAAIALFKEAPCPAA